MRLKQDESYNVLVRWAVVVTTMSKDNILKCPSELDPSDK